MSDNLSWRNRHLVLLRYESVEAAAREAKYPLRPDLAADAKAEPGAAGFIKRLRETDRDKDAASFLAYDLHRRAAVWWVYMCVLSLRDELAEVPAQEVDLDQVAAPRKPEVPEWARPLPIDEEKLAEAKARITEQVARFESAKAQIEARIHPEAKRRVDRILQTIKEKFKEKYGIDDIYELLRTKAAMTPPDSQVDIAASPITLAVEELKRKIEANRKETIARVKAVNPPKIPDYEAMVAKESLDAVWSWICVPSIENAVRCLNAGNANSQTPEGFLALSAFWSCGNLDVTGARHIPTPEGLAGKGLEGTILMCGLAKGGTRTFKERMGLYVDLGLEVAWGRSTWKRALEGEKYPHKTPGWMKIVLEGLRESPGGDGSAAPSPVVIDGRYRAPGGS